MHSCEELNILCIGELMAGKSTFLERYTDSEPSDEHLKIFLRKEQKLGCLVFLEEVEQRDNVQVYLRPGFDGVLFFVKIDDFHNTAKNVLESLALLSQVSGVNVYKIPIKIVVISSKDGKEYDDIAYGEKRSLYDEVNNILSEEQIIYVESGRSYEDQLTQFYKELLTGTSPGIKETTYSNWFIRGTAGLLSLDQFKLQAIRLYEDFRETFLSRLKQSPVKWREGLLYFWL